MFHISYEMQLTKKPFVGEELIFMRLCIGQKIPLKPLGGQLGLRHRRRAWQAALCLGKVHAAFDPRIPEWDFLFFGMSRKRREHGELKRLSTRRKRNQSRCHE